MPLSLFLRVGSIPQLFCIFTPVFIELSAMFNLKTASLIFISTIMLVGCSGEVDSPIQEKDVTIPKTPTQKLQPEDDHELKGTPVLGFKLRDSTYDSVKHKLKKYSIIDGESYSGGPILENDGSNFSIDGLTLTQFGFDKNNKLVYVAMVIRESDHMSHETYNKIVGFVQKNDYHIVSEKAPFVGDRETVFSTPNDEKIVVRAPHLGGFQITVEYFTNEFDVLRSNQQKEAKEQKDKSEAANF